MERYPKAVRGTILRGEMQQTVPIDHTDMENGPKLNETTVSFSHTQECVP